MATITTIDVFQSNRVIHVFGTVWGKSRAPFFRGFMRKNGVARSAQTRFVRKQQQIPPLRYGMTNKYSKKTNPLRYF
ncbi:hypothetical protein AciPR4_1155 [Terriglobus saanensis SP1PR4]|uniref:Uncharacterized protein n=1 Tax=Terriglobus saanensis (strain ATCC BAA-1853 / DSM 23119 / SP1PR4) TaxID=401053 RepID=E8UXN9_TERSS|nr:hypothetical protein AciPR4_1155 [Terriglobus saanensis SP1PR4]